MLLAKKIRLLPTPEQEILFWKSAGVARWSYNYYLGKQKEQYKLWQSSEKECKKRLKEREIRKEINNVLKPTTHQWLKEVGSNVMKQAVKEADKAFKKFLKGDGGFPKFKTKRKTKPSFYVNYESLKAKNGGFHGEKIGFVRTSEPMPRCPKDKKYSNPWISFDGKYWYLSVGFEQWQRDVKLNDEESIGIDLGLKKLATCYMAKSKKSMIFKNINKIQTVRRIKKRLRREQRKHSRKIKAKIDHYEQVVKGGQVVGRKPIFNCSLPDCKNLEKQRRKIALIYRRLTNIRQNYLHQTTTAIVKTKPSRIVIEDLNIKGMMKNKHLSRSIKEAKFHEFRRQLEYKTKRYGIELVVADRFYPSSKTCFSCGYIKKDLKLKDRTYVCPHCGATIDRDLNAAMNLATYNQKIS